jgi:cation transport ATPase
LIVIKLSDKVYFVLQSSLFFHKEVKTMLESDLKSAERIAFTNTTDTGLRDLVIASCVSMLAIAPLLSESLGDFWSSAAFLPFVGAVYLLTRVIHKRVVAPRLGEAQWGPERKRQMKRMSVVMLTVNVVAFVLGIVAWFSVGRGASVEMVFPISLALIVLILFSALAHTWSVPRYFLYGAMLCVASLIGEWLFRRGYASQHGFPVAFGTTASIISLAGLVRLSSVLRKPVPTVED